MNKITFRKCCGIAMLLSFFSASINLNAQCLAPTYGQYPAATITAMCDGQTQNIIAADGYAGEYSLFTAVAGQTYTFSSSIATDYITISTDNFATAATHGTTPLTWVSSVSGDVTLIYTNNAACGEDTNPRIKSFVCGVATTETPDYVGLQWPPTATISAGTTLTVYGQVYEGGLTDVEPNIGGQAPGIQAWIGVNDENTDPATWTNWTPAMHNVDMVGNNDEYSAAVGAALMPGEYYYATRFRLNDGLYVYGGINSSNQGNFWDGSTYVSGVLTVEPPTNSLSGVYVAVTERLDNGATVTFSNEVIDFVGIDVYNTATTGLYYAQGQDPGTGPSVVLPAAIDGGYTFSRVGDNLLVATQNLANAYTNEVRQSAAQYNVSTIDNTTGVITVEYSVFFTGNTVERAFRSVYTPIPLAVGQNEFASFSYYPNPVENVLNISNTQEISKVEFYNLLGQSVMTTTLNLTSGQIDMSALSNGPYFVKVNSGKQIKTIKVIKE